MHSPSWSMLAHSACCHRVATAMMEMDGTFDGTWALLAWHKIAAVNYCCWASDIDPLVLLLPLHTVAWPDDVKRKPANRPSASGRRPMLQLNGINENDHCYV